MKKNLKTLLSALTTAVPLDISGNNESALTAWVEKYGERLVAEAKELLKDGPTYSEVGQLAETAAAAVNELKPIFDGLEVAAVAQVVIGAAARVALPDLLEPWIMPLIEGEGARALIKAAYERVLGPQAVAAPPVLDDASLPAGGTEK